MTAHVELLLGVAGAGKTARLQERYRIALRQALERRAPGTTLWLAPTHRACRLVLAELPDESLPACFAPNVLTFDEFAERILEASTLQVAPLGDAAKRTLLRSIIDRLHQQGRLPFFSRLAGTAGFLDLVSRFISELKRDETWPEAFIEACQARGERPKDRELALIYQQYQQALVDLSLYDAEGRFWSARAVLAEGARAPFDRLTHVVVDGFTDFTWTQYEILELLAAWAERISISLPLEAPLKRENLFAKSAAAYDRLQQISRTGATIVDEQCQRDPEAEHASIAHIAEFLFANPRTTPRLPSADGVELLEVTGQRGEVEVLAERVKRLLLAGAAPDEIVIALRSPDEYADLIDEVFSAACIPCWCEAGSPLLRAPVLKGLFAVLQLELEDWPFDRLTGLLDSNYFRPAWKECKEGRAAREVADVLRKRKLHSGREMILESLKRLAERTDESDDDDSALVVSRRLLDRLSEATAPLRDRHDFAAWCGIVCALAEELGIVPTDAQDDEDRALSERDRRCWRRLERVLDDALHMAQLAGETDKTFDLAEFDVRLHELLRTQAVPPDGSETGRVRILEASQVRHLDVPYLFVAGLTETSFPRHQAEDCLYGETDRRELNSHGLSLRHRTSHGQEEMLLFYGVVTRARRQLVLSYPSVSAAGEPLFSSPYVGSLRDLFEPAALPSQPVVQLDPVPPKDRVLAPADLRIIATLELSEDQPALFRTLADMPATAACAGNILVAAEMAHARFHTRGFTEFEGLLQDDRHRNALARRYGTDYEFSPTRLEEYAQCPFRYLVSHVMGIEPRESPQVATDHLGRGSLVHRVLASLHRQLHDEGISPEALSPQELAQRFCELVKDHWDRRFDSKLQTVLDDIERDLLAEWADAYAEQWEAYRRQYAKLWDAPPTSLLLETAFGHAPDDELGEQQAAEYVSVGAGKEATRIQGRIDRIDVGTADGRPVFNVIDYKTGRPPRFNSADVQSGRALQLVLYALAVARLGLAGKDAVPFQLGYWTLKLNGFVSGLKNHRKPRLEADDWQTLQQAAEGVVPRLAASMRAGVFPVYNADEGCGQFCPYSTVCRVAQVRALPEGMEKRFEA